MQARKTEESTFEKDLGWEKAWLWRSGNQREKGQVHQAPELGFMLRKPRAQYLYFRAVTLAQGWGMC